MLLSLNWLRDHVDLSGLAPEQIARDLTMRTALIEGVVDQGAALEGVVVGKVLECGRHPDADRLSLCQVDDGSAEPKSVVCGAPNVAAGQTIVYAPVGTRLPNGLKLKKAKIRGVPSAGMICAEDELGLGSEHDGILVLDDKWDAGLPIAEVADFTDVLFDIDNKSVTHRPDLWGHYGFARELAAIYGRELRPLALDDSLAAGASAPALALEAECGCRAYAALGVADTPRRSPDWLRLRLSACGMRPLNHLVDLSNYVMLEIGQPTHPFDRDRLASDALGARAARDGETLTTLDDQERQLAAGDVLIVNGESIVALGGIMGGADAEVSDATTRVVLESACFDPVRVRRTSSRIGLRTDALARFEKDLDPALMEQALRRYAQLLRQISPSAEVEGQFAATGDSVAPARTLALDPAMVSARLGLELSDEEVVAPLSALGFRCDTKGAEWAVEVPSWRATRDVTRAEDLVEEVGRLVGYERIPDDASVARMVLGERDALPALEDELRAALSGAAGFTEVFGYSTVRDRALELVGWPDDDKRPVLINALQKDAMRLRPCLAPGLLEHVESWLRHAPEVRCYEIGRGYAVSGEDVVESRELALIWAARERVDARAVVATLRGVVDHVARALERSAPRLRPLTPAAGEPWLHPARSAEVFSGETVWGRLGALSPATLDTLELEGSVGLVSLDLAAMVRLPRDGGQYAPVPRMPAARYDMAFLIGPQLSVDELLDAIRAAGPKTLREVSAFDVYRGAPLEPGQRSVSVHLVFRAEDRTLEAKALGKAIQKIVDAVEGVGASLRVAADAVARKE